jgi:hypothetical protein
MTPFAPPPIAPTRGRGCVIALSIAMAIIGIGIVAAVIGFAMFATSDTGKGALKAISDGTKVAAKGLKAPGTPELRALGCQQAMVTEMRDFATVMGDLDAGDMSTVPNDLLVTCQGKAFETPPTCDEVASTYVRAVGKASSEFFVTVTRQGSSKPDCEQLYDETGVSLGSIKTR